MLSPSLIVALLAESVANFLRKLHGTRAKIATAREGEASVLLVYRRFRCCQATSPKLPPYSPIDDSNQWRTHNPLPAVLPAEEAGSLLRALSPRKVRMDPTITNPGYSQGSAL
jgi:hypothetical protein